MSTMGAISLTTAPANASEIALGKMFIPRSGGYSKIWGLPLHHHTSCSILIVVPNEDHTRPWPVQQNNPPRHSADARVAQGPPCQFR